MIYTVYALYNAQHKKIYVGQTKDVDDRLRLHNDHIFPKSYTARFDGLWDLIYTEEVETKSEALKRERQLKSYQGRYFLRQLMHK